MPRSTARLVFNPEFIALLGLSALTRFWSLFTPNAVVFDELHFEHHAGHYLDGTYYFDVHPPLGKLLYAAEARLFGISTGTLLAGQPAVVLRVLPALLGTLLVPLIYILLRQLRASRSVAALGGFLVLCDNALLVDSRLILLEPLLISFGLTAIVLFLAARAHAGAARLWLLSLAAFAAGCAISVKWTGASALGVILVVWLADSLSVKREWPRIAREGALLVLIPSLVYVSAFAVHFALLPRAGVDDGVMTLPIRQSLVGDPWYNANAKVSLFAKLADIHRAIGAGNRSLEGATHPAASPWYTWPIMKHPIGLWQDATPRTQSVVLVGNPVVWWGAGIGALIALVMILRRRELARRWRFALLFVSGCYLINSLPFVAITRVMYLYHYLFAELWMSVLAAFAIGVVAGWQDSHEAPLWSFPSRKSAALYWGIAALVLVGFVYFAPLTYGWTLTPRAYDARFWVLHPHF
jgi:dolichyl-phosphate-mannose-protein mannosyltransferase